jgi:hypothetical protein
VSDQVPPDFVIGAGAPSAPTPKRTVHYPRWPLDITVAMATGLLALLVRIFMGGPFVPLAGFWLVALLLFLSAAALFRTVPIGTLTVPQLNRYAGARICLGLAVAAELGAVDLYWGATGLILVAAWLTFCWFAPQRQIVTHWTVDVAVPPDRAYAFKLDPHNWPLYTPGLALVGPIPDTMRVGAIVRERYKQLEADTTVLELVPNRLIVSCVVGSASRGRDEFEAIPGGTRITHSYHGRRSYAAMVSGTGFQGRKVRANLDKVYRYQAEHLKALLGSPSAASV